MNTRQRTVLRFSRLPLFTLLGLSQFCQALTAADPVEKGRSVTRSTERQRGNAQSILKEFQTRSRFPGAVMAVCLSDGSSFAVASGYSNRDTKEPMRESDLLHAGSVGKTLFAALALQLIGEGRISLDDQAAKYLAEEEWYSRLPNADQITIRTLLNHTSGLPPLGEGFMRELAQSPGTERSPVEAIESVIGSKPLSPVGSKFSYSDVNYLVLGRVVEHVTGVRAYEEIKRRLLVPLGLKLVIPADSPAIPGLVPGYAGKANPFGGDRMIKDRMLVFNPKFEWAAGGYVANAEDLARWIAAFCEGRAFPASLLPDVLAAVDAPELGPSARYGLGLVIENTPVGEARGHGGFFPGYVTWARWYPQQRIGIAMQVNASEDALFVRPVREVLDDVIHALSSD